MAHPLSSASRAIAGLAVVAAAGVAAAQQPAPPAPAFVIPPGVPEVGTMAPDFTLPGISKYGILRDSIRLSSFRGQTVVVAFFPKARTKG
jgi:peroxiredoxin Q/BCP